MRKTFSFFVPLIIGIFFAPSTLAKWGTFTITDNNGEQVVVKHGLLGKKNSSSG